MRLADPQDACRPCETIVAAPVAPAVIDGGIAATGLLAWVLIGKFLDHLPLYRLAQIAARQDVPLALSTLADWVGRLLTSVGFFTLLPPRKLPALGHCFPASQATPPVVRV